VALIVFDGKRDDDRGERDRGDIVTSSVETRQIAPTILKFLGLDPEELRSVRLEGTRGLPN
jgi:hypothetical protein